jgi:hypothetical protein
MVLTESVNITMAFCYPLKINDWSFIILPVDCSSVTTAYRTFSCKSLCGRCIFRLPVLGIRCGTFRLVFFFSIYRETNPYLSHRRCTYHDGLIWSGVFFTFFHQCSFFREVLTLVLRRVLAIRVSLHSRRTCSGLSFVIW